MDKFDIINKHGLNDGFDNDRMIQALSLLPEMAPDTLEEVFQTLISLEKKGLISFHPYVEAPEIKFQLPN